MATKKTWATHKIITSVISFKSKLFNLSYESYPGHRIAFRIEGTKRIIDPIQKDIQSIEPITRKTR